MDNVDTVQPAGEDDERTSKPTAEPARSDAGDRAKPAKNDQSSKDGEKSKDGEDAPKKKGSKLPLILLGIVVLLAAIGAVIWWFLHRNQTDTDDAYTDGRVVMMASQVNGYVTVLAVNDNQFVHRGDLLVQIDPRAYEAARDQAKGELASAQAQLDNARIALDKAKTTFPAQLAQAQGQLAQAQGTFYNAQTDYKRQHAVERGATTQQNVDQSTAGLKTAQGQVQAAQAQVDIAKLIPQNIAQTAAQVKPARGSGGPDAQATLDRPPRSTFRLCADVTAPQDGWVTKRNVEQGNYLQPGAANHGARHARHLDHRQLQGDATRPACIAGQRG